MLALGGYHGDQDRLAPGLRGAIRDPEGEADAPLRRAAT
jgi:hypothetical protein